jgi:hypothetical protein
MLQNVKRHNPPRNYILKHIYLQGYASRQPANYLAADLSPTKLCTVHVCILYGCIRRISRASCMSLSKGAFWTLPLFCKYLSDHLIDYIFFFVFYQMWHTREHFFVKFLHFLFVDNIKYKLAKLLTWEWQHWQKLWGDVIKSYNESCILTS